MDNWLLVVGMGAVFLGIVGVIMAATSSTEKVGVARSLDAIDAIRTAPDSMRALADRTDVGDLRGFITAMVQADAFGIPIANVLRIQAREMRIRRSQRAEEQAQKVPVKILFPLIFCIMPALFIVIMGPAAIQIADSFSGL